MPRPEGRGLETAEVSTKAKVKNALSIDLEDWYQGILQIDYNHWHQYENRIEKNLIMLLDLFSQRNIRATFFVLGYIAEKFPATVEMIARAGHEIASHGFHHRPIFEQTACEFRQDVLRSKESIEAITKERVRGYRAPFFSITKGTLWALDILRDLGFDYDSSIFPTKNFLYGIPDAPLRPYRINNGNMIEFPLSVVKRCGINIPISGGFYLRAFPYYLTKLGLLSYNCEGDPAIIYIHPWELDADKPKLPMALTLKWKLIYEYNLAKMKKKFELLIRDFEFTTVSEALNVKFKVLLT